MEQLDASAVGANRRDGRLTAEEMGMSTSRYSLEMDKESVVAQIKHSFEVETQSFRSQIQDATEEAARARTRIHDVHAEMLRLRKKCFKLQKILQERDATIACLEEQRDLELPMIMHETMRNLQHSSRGDAHEDPLRDSYRASVHRNRHQRSVAQEEIDDRVHEYEKQISRLYEELHQEKQKNEVLRDRLTEEKQAKAKLMKACKFARREIEKLKESDLTDLLEDLEIKCHELERKNKALKDDVEHERTEVGHARRERDDLEDELRARRQDSSEWAARLEAKQREIERLRAQIHEQQCALENFQQDYDLVVDRTAPRTDSDLHLELQQECDMLMRTLHRERGRVAELERQILEQSSRSQLRDRSATAVASSDTVASEVRYQIGVVHDKILRLRRRLLEGIEMHGLYASAGLARSRLSEDISDALLEGSRASAALIQCGAEVDGLHDLMDDAFARGLGANCAMQ